MNQKYTNDTNKHNQKLINISENQKIYRKNLHKSFGFPICSFPGIDSWVQPRLNLGFSWILNPANLGEPSEQVTQVSCVLEPSLSSLAGFIKTKKKPGFSWVCWVRCQSNKTFRVGFTGFQLTQVTWVQKPSLPSLAGFIKTLKAGFARFVAKATKPQRAGFAGFWNPADPA